MILHMSRYNIYVNPHNNKFGKDRNDHILSWFFFYPGFRRFPQTKVDLSITLGYPKIMAQDNLYLPAKTSETLNKFCIGYMRDQLLD
jgi:hypothetical protein